MAGSRLRAFRTYGTNSSLRASLLEFASTGGGICTTLVPAAHGRLRTLSQDVEDVTSVSFDKVIARFLTLGGEAMLPVADSLQEKEALARACRALPPESPFYACREFSGFVRRLGATLRELRLWRMSREELLAAASRAEPYLRAKLESLAFLDERLRAGLRSAARELESERMERCLTLQIPSGSRQRLWVYAGGEFAPLWADWLAWAAKVDVEVWLVVDSRTPASRTFQGADRMLERLHASAAKIGGANGLAEGLFAEQARLDVGLDVRVLSVGDPLAEVEWAMRVIREAADNGLPLSRSAIYARNLEDYAPLLQASAARFGVPIRLSRRERLSENGWLRLVLGFLEACLKTDPRGLREAAESSYLDASAAPSAEAGESSREGLPLDDAEAERAEAWASMHLPANHYRSLINLSLSNPDPWLNLRERLDPANESDHWLIEACRLHAKAEMGPIGFREGYDELVELLDQPWLDRPLEENSPTKIRDVAARSALLHALEQRAALGEAAGEEVGFAEFVAELIRIAEDADYGWPGTEDGIQCASSAYAVGGAEVLCVLGMIEGAFPRRRSEDPILSDSERAQIDALRPGGAKLKSSHDDARAERDELVRLCAAAGRELVLLYPQVGDDRDNTPAFYLSEIERVAGSSAIKRDIPAARLAPLPEECRFEADATLRTVLDDVKSFPEELRLDSLEAMEAVKGMPDDGVAPRELGEVLRCPFQYVMRRKLDLWPGRLETKWHLVRQIPDVAGLTLAESEEEARRALARALESELEELGPEISPAERKLFEAGGRREVEGWIGREFLSRQIWREKESEWSASVAFGEGGTAGELPLRGETIKLKGRFAGLGDLKGFAVGQLYGSRSYGVGRSLDKIEDPDFLELGAYIWSLCKRRQRVALEIDTNNGERLLLMLPRPEDCDIESRVTQGLRVIELGDKQEFYERVKGLMAEAVGRMKEGRIDVRPGEHCRTCDYGELCRRAEGYGEVLDPFEAEEIVAG